MAITPFRGKFHVEWFPKTASTAFSYGDLVYLSSGYLTGMGATTDQPPAGLILKAVASTDSDYASTTMVPVLVGDINAEYLFDVGTGTAAASHVGTWVDLDGTYPKTKVTVDASTYDIVFVTKVISTTQVVGKLQSLDPYQ